MALSEKLSDVGLIGTSSSLLEIVPNTSAAQDDPNLSGSIQLSTSPNIGPFAFYGPFPRTALDGPTNTVSNIVPDDEATIYFSGPPPKFALGSSTLCPPSRTTSAGSTLSSAIIVCNAGSASGGGNPAFLGASSAAKGHPAVNGQYIFPVSTVPDDGIITKEQHYSSGRSDVKKRRVHKKASGIVSVNANATVLRVRSLVTAAALVIAKSTQSTNPLAIPGDEIPPDDPSVSVARTSEPDVPLVTVDEGVSLAEFESRTDEGMNTADSCNVSNEPIKQFQSDVGIPLRIIDIPAYLHNSEFYKSLQDGEEEETILVPSDCMKPNDTVSTNEDLRSLLMTLRFWVGSCICDSILMYVANQPAVATEATFAEFEPDFPILKHFQQLAQSAAPIKLAIDTGDLELVNYYLARGFSWPEDACDLIANVGNIDMLKAALAAQCSVSANTTDIAARQGHLNCLRFLTENGGICTMETIAAAVTGNHMDCLQYAHQQLQPTDQRRWRETWLYDPALSNHNLEMVQYLHKNGWAWNLETSRTAAKYGQMSFFTYMQENGDSCWDRSVCEVAVKHGHVETALFLLRAGCLPSNNVWNYVGDVFYQVLQIFLESKLPWSAAPDAMLTVITSGNLEGLVCLVEKGCPWYPYATSYIAKTGDLAMLQYAHENGCPWSHKTCFSATSLDCLKYAHTHGAPFPTDVCDRMLRTCSMQKTPVSCACFKYAHQRGCYLRSIFTAYAAEMGNLELLQYLYEQGVEWHDRVASDAAQSMHADCLEFAVTHGAPYIGSHLVTMAELRRDPSCMKLARKYKNGCPQLTEVNRSAWNRRRVYYLLRNGTAVTNRLWDMTSEEFREVLQQAVQEGQLWTATPDAMRHVIETGSLEFLKCLIENGCPWHPQTTSYIAKINSLVMLQFAHENGCPWSKDTCMRSASLLCMMYAHTHGAPIPSNACELLLFYCAQPKVSFECFKYAHQHGGVLLSRFVSYAESSHHAELLEYLHEHESEWAVTPAADLRTDGVAILQKRGVIKIKRRAV